MVCEGDLVEKYEIKKRISKGTFGELFIARDIYTNERVAIKVQSTELDAGLKWEGNILKQLSGGIYTPTFISIGQYNQQDYIVMELLGDDMSTYRQILRQNIYTYGYLYQLPISIHLAKQMIDCIEYVHQKGLVHRDVKPANFVKRKGTDQTYCIVDFGIAKQHVDGDGVRPERTNAEFRGTTMYASLNTHEDKDQSFRDDLWSVIFSFVDILLGHLPWSEEGKKKEKVLVKDLKKEFTSNPQDQKFSKWILDQILSTEAERVSPTQTVRVKEEDMSWNYFNDILDHLNTLAYSDTPNYNLIRSLLDNILLSKEPGAEPIFPSLVSLPKEENLQDTESTIQVSPAWIFSDISEKDFIHLQDIITLRSDKLLSDIKSLSLFNTSTSIDNSSFSLEQLTPSSITQLISFPKIWMALFTCVIQLPEANIEWRTIQSLQSVLRKAQWFYFYGLYTSQSTNTSAENISSYLIDWNDFVKLQMAIYQFSNLLSRVRYHHDGPDGEILSFSSHQQQKFRKRSLGDMMSGE